MLVLLFDSDSFGKCGSGLINLELTCSISGSTRDFIFSNVGGTFSRTTSKVGPSPVSYTHLTLPTNREV